MNLKTNILNDLNDQLVPLHFECYPFRVGWYNSIVDVKFKLNLHDDTLSILVINTPAMFETVFLVDLFKRYKNTMKSEDSLENLNDPLDECLSRLFENVKQVTL